MTLVAGTQSDTAQFRNALREVAEAEAPNAPIGQVQRLDEMVAEMSDDFRSIMRVFLSFAVTAVVLAAIGIYGLMSYWVSQRTYEIGLRVAMGASRGQIVRMIYGQGLSVASYGIVAGLAAAWLATRFLASLLFGVAPTDAATFVSAAALIAGVACLTVSLPAWRATRIDPIRTLRAD
jgi:putative ABC transport system permease protein